jgi:hypothetical protein
VICEGRGLAGKYAGFAKRTERNLRNLCNQWTNRKRGGVVKRFLICGIVVLFVLGGCEQTPEAGKTLTNSGDTEQEEEYSPFTGSVSSSNTSPMGRGVTRSFTVESDGKPVIWTVEGGSDGGGTVIAPFNKFTGRLTVGNNENSMILTVKALSVEEDNAVLGTATVKVKVWRELTAGLKGLITYRTNGFFWFRTGVDDVSFGIRVLAYGEGVGTGKGRWVLGGGSDFRYGLDDSGNGYHFWPVMIYSDDDGETWTEIHTTPALLYEENTLCLVYDGPPNDKKFVLGTGRGNVFWSYDGVKWTKFLDVFPGSTPADGIKYINQALYGDIDANGGRGRYIAVGTRGRFTWSDDGGKTWVQHYTTADERYVYTSPIEGVFPGGDGVFVRYGTGFIGGKRVKMFFMEGTNHKIEGGVIHSYSLDGIDWVILAENKVDAVQFEPATPGGANARLSWKDEVDTSNILFATEEIEPYTWWAIEGTLKEDTGVNKHVDFVAYGNGKYLAVGLGRRLAIGYADVFKK